MKVLVSVLNSPKQKEKNHGCVSENHPLLTTKGEHGKRRHHQKRRSKNLGPNPPAADQKEARPRSILAVVTKSPERRDVRHEAESDDAANSPTQSFGCRRWRIALVIHISSTRRWCASTWEVLRICRCSGRTRHCNLIYITAASGQTATWLRDRTMSALPRIAEVVAACWPHARPGFRGKVSRVMLNRHTRRCGRAISREAYRSEECRLPNSPATTAQSRNQRRNAPDRLARRF